MFKKTLLIGGVFVILILIAACGATPTPETIIETVVVKETVPVEVEKVVTQEVEKITTVEVEKEVVVVETVEVEKEVEKIVTVEVAKVVTVEVTPESMGGEEEAMAEGEEEAMAEGEEEAMAEGEEEAMAEGEEEAMAEGEEGVMAKGALEETMSEAGVSTDNPQVKELVEQVPLVQHHYKPDTDETLFTCVSRGMGLGGVALPEDDPIYVGPNNGNFDLWGVVGLFEIQTDGSMSFVPQETGGKFVSPDGEELQSISMVDMLTYFAEGEALWTGEHGKVGHIAECDPQYDTTQ